MVGNPEVTAFFVSLHAKSPSIKPTSFPGPDTQAGSTELSWNTLIRLDIGRLQGGRNPRYKATYGDKSWRSLCTVSIADHCSVPRTYPWVGFCHWTHLHATIPERAASWAGRMPTSQDRAVGSFGKGFPSAMRFAPSLESREGWPKYNPPDLSRFRG